MRPLLHPAVENVKLENILHALSDPVRAAIFARIVSLGCPQSCSAFLQVDERCIPKSTLSQHFRALREAGLIRSERQGSEMHNTSRHLELEERFPGLVKAILLAHQVQQGPCRAPGKKPAARSRRSTTERK